MDERKLRILTGQRQDLERELEALQTGLDALVCLTCFCSESSLSLLHLIGIEIHLFYMI